MYVISNDKSLTKEEIKFQKALGTLSLWQRVKFGDIKVEEVTLQTSSSDDGDGRICVNINHDKVKSVTCDYIKSDPKSRKEAINSIIDYLKEKYD